MFVFGEVQEPLEETTKLVEQVVRAEAVNLISRSVQQTAKRNSRFLQVEDLLFLIRHDKQKVARLRSFLNWKDVRKNLQDTDTPTDNEDSESIRLSGISLFYWDALYPYQSILEDADDADQDDLLAYQEMKRRLHEADLATNSMSKEDYIYYSEKLRKKILNTFCPRTYRSG